MGSMNSEDSEKRSTCLCHRCDIRLGLRMDGQRDGSSENRDEGHMSDHRKMMRPSGEQQGECIDK